MNLVPLHVPLNVYLEVGALTTYATKRLYSAI